MGAIVVAAMAMIGVTGQEPDPKRIDAIWDSTYNRLNTQLDIWFSDGDFPKCISLLKSQYVIWPKDYEVATNLGWMEENVEDIDGAIQTYQRYRLENPKDPDAALPEAQMYFNRGRFKRDPDGFAKAIRLLEPAVGSPAHPNVYRILASSYERTGKFEESLRVWKVYLDKHPDDLAGKKNMERVEKKLHPT
ncbi:hypothetical protein BH11ARM2_BH11ARM2_16470 [soil metagenome]